MKITVSFQALFIMYSNILQEPVPYSKGTPSAGTQSWARELP